MTQFPRRAVEYEDAFEIGAPDGNFLPLAHIDDVDVPVDNEWASHDVSPHAPIDQLVPDPSPDYAIELTTAGGIEITYKTLDERARVKFLAAALWAAATSIDAWFLHANTPPMNALLSVACGLVAALLNLIVVSKPVEIYRSVEIRPDCMIIDRKDVFLVRHLQGWPGFQPGHLGIVLCGVYGTREVEFLSLPTFDEFDRTPQVFAAHLEYAMQQLWTRFTSDPSTAGAPRPSRSKGS